MLRFHLFPLILGSALLGAGCGGNDEPTSGSTSSGSGGAGGDTTSSSGGAGGSGGSGGGGGSDIALCAKQHDEGSGSKKLIVCDDAFDAAPFVHLPKASATDDVMALVRCQSFVDRAGEKHAPSKALVKSLCMDHSPGGDARVHAFDLYRVTLDDGGGVTAFSRYAVIDEKNLLRPLIGTAAEGKISKKKSGDTFDLDPSIPIRVSFGQAAVMQSAKDGTTTYDIVGTVENLTSGVTSSDGSCLSAIADDPGNPFPGAKKASLQFFRVPSMHLAGDDEGVIDIRADDTSMGTTMAPTWFLGPETLFKALTTPAAYQGFGHGTPGAIPNLDLALKKGGGVACSP